MYCEFQVILDYHYFPGKITVIEFFQKNPDNQGGGNFFSTVNQRYTVTESDFQQVGR